MSCKNLKQQILANSWLSEHDDLTGLDAVHELIDWSCIESLLSGIHNKACSCGENAAAILVPHLSDP